MFLLHRFLIISLSLLSGALLAHAEDEASCRPFRVHLAAVVPAPPTAFLSVSSPTTARENDLVTAIAGVRGHADFPRSWREWLMQNPQMLNQSERAAWLSCLFFYVRQDTDHDGTPDWTALVDHRPSRILYPFDEDMDGDGTPNILDPAPLNRQLPTKKEKAITKKNLPAHLRLKGEAGSAQEALFHRHHILAIDHTDQHSAAVLKEFVQLLDQGFPAGALQKVTSLRYFYAFAGHDARHDIAAFHREAYALSIGGISTYEHNDLDQATRIRVLVALAHEVGHAFVFDRLTPSELRAAGSQFGGWNESTSAKPEEQGNPHLTTVNDDFYAPKFFTAHVLALPARHVGRGLSELFGFVSAPRWRERSIVSQYATRNLHEWFAESFAAHILNRYGESGFLGRNWQRSLVLIPEHHSDYWANYNNIAPAFRQWLEQRLKPLPSP